MRKHRPKDGAGKADRRGCGNHPYPLAQKVELAGGVAHRVRPVDCIANADDKLVVSPLHPEIRRKYERGEAAGENGQKRQRVERDGDEQAGLLEQLMPGLHHVVQMKA